MIDDAIYLAKDIIDENADERFNHLKVYASKIVMLSFMEFEEYEGDLDFGNIFDALKDILNNILMRLREKNVSDEEIDEFINTGERHFYKVFLFKLKFQDQLLEEIINEPSITRNIRMKNIIKNSIEHYLKKDQLIFTNVCINISEFLNCFNFKPSIYTEMYILKLLSFSVSSDDLSRILIEKLGHRDQFVTCFNDPNSESNDDIWDIERILSVLFPILLELEPENQPLMTIKQILEEINPMIDNIESVANIIAFKFFSEPNVFIDTHRINSMVSYFGNNKDLCSASLCNSLLKISITKQGSKNYLYPKDFIHIIYPFGYKDSSRFSFDRLILIGRLNNDYTQSDIFLDERFSNQELIIISDEKGYYISDYSIQGLTARLLNDNEDFEVKAGTIFRLEKVFIAVLNVFADDQVRNIEMNVFQGGKYPNQIIWGKLNGEGDIIGVGNFTHVKIDEEPTMIKGQPSFLVSREHCHFVLKNGKVYLKSIPGKKTWVNLKERKELESTHPSKFWRISNGDTIRTKDVMMKFDLFITS